MKSKAQVLREWPDYKRLINAVIGNIGLESVEDVNNHGIAGGFNGFIYYTDTHEFAMKYRKQITALLEELADSLDEDVVSIVCSFRYVNGDKDDKKDLYRYLGGAKVEQCSITNAMAWFAAEEVCKMFEE